MSGSNWDKRLAPVAAAGFCVAAIIGAFAIAYVVGALNGKQAYQRYADPHAHAEAAKEQAKRSCLGTEAAAVFECVYDKVEASEDTARTEEDLVAQQRAAWAAIIGAGIGFLTMALSAIGLWFIYETLKATRAAVVEANEATAAAHKAVEVTKDSTEKQLRAYVSVSEVRLVRFGPGQCFGYIKIVNLGATPAKITNFSRKAWVGPRNVIDPISHGPETSDSAMHKRGLGRDQSDDVGFWLPVNEPFDGVIDNQHDFYVYGRVDYEDIFQKKWWVTFAYTPSGYTTNIDTQFVPCPFGNAAT